LRQDSTEVGLRRHPGSGAERRRPPARTSRCRKVLTWPSDRWSLPRRTARTTARGKPP